MWFKPNKSNTKVYKGNLLIDKELDTNILDKINSNKNINVKHTCAGHKGGNKFSLYPSIQFDVYSNTNVNSELKQLDNATFRCKKNYKSTSKRCIIRGTKGSRNNKQWWSNISDALYRI